MNYFIFFFKKFKELTYLIFCAGIICIASLMSCSSFIPQLPYKTSEIASFESKGRGVELIFETKLGQQSVFYIPPKIGYTIFSKQLIVIYSGWLSRALDWQGFIDRFPERSRAFLLIDYPGYGNCKGRMNPDILYENSSGAFKALSQHLNINENELIKNSIFLGHSFGCYAALQYAERVNVKRIVLVAPFTSLHDMAFRKCGPFAWIIPWKMNNKAFIKNLSRRYPRPSLIIIHGTADHSVPVKMGRKLANLFPAWIAYNEIEGGDHMNIFVAHQNIVFQALKLD